MPTPERIKPGKKISYSSLAVVPDARALDARLQISQSAFNELRAGTGESSNAPIAAVVGQSSTRTILAGLLMFFAVSIAGVLVARKARVLWTGAESCGSACFLCWRARRYGSHHTRKRRTWILSLEKPAAGAHAGKTDRWRCRCRDRS